MKKIIITLLFFMLIIFNTFSDTNNTSKSNGTVIESKSIGNIKYITREHLQRIQIGDLASEKNLYIYNQPEFTNSEIASKLKLDDYINTMELLEIIDTDNKETNVWIKIVTDNKISGWIYFGKSDPYEDDRWSILEVISSSNRKWAIRKLEQWLAVLEVLNVRDNPGIEGTTVLFKLIPENKNQQINVNTLAITEELDTIDGIKDHWVKIKDEKGRIGWIFGGYATVERGGPKYYIPDNTVYFGLGYY